MKRSYDLTNRCWIKPTYWQQVRRFLPTIVAAAALLVSVIALSGPGMDRVIGWETGR